MLYTQTLLFHVTTVITGVPGAGERGWAKKVNKKAGSGRKRGSPGAEENGEHWSPAKGLRGTTPTSTNIVIWQQKPPQQPLGQLRRCVEDQHLVLLEEDHQGRLGVTPIGSPP